MDFSSFVMSTALVSVMVKVSDLVKSFANKDFAHVKTQVVHWVMSVALVMLTAASPVGAATPVGSLGPVGKLSLFMQVLVGLGLGSVGSMAYDFRPGASKTASIK